MAGNFMSGGPGPKKGERRGGIQKGGKHKATIARERAEKLIAEAGKAPAPQILPPAAVDPEQAAQAVTAKRSKLAVDVLDQFMHVFAGMAAQAQPRYEKSGKLISGNPAEFERWAKLTVATADRLAPYQTPALKAIIAAAAPTVGPAEKSAAERVTGQDPQRAAKTYLTIIKGGAA